VSYLILILLHGSAQILLCLLQVGLAPLQVSTQQLQLFLLRLQDAQTQHALGHVSDA
jgi:hypothetical protein